ncbi:predicted protein [Naegleria gruberi]|uniref:Carboxylic ester hydrolase n=1 Tax=Naegleria gruberi TaxID=5762 RepID=D2V6Y9_NAEGR|nr:uncharacterized protein NAEGRDRAFT_64604 [Naegleria gruberi]EFC47534.1 predicted protein [Naegleria gruberi]|eukprot:XP_002680278.1 predicted protein [Naegleria gruberi strain NEG-M]
MKTITYLLLLLSLVATITCQQEQITVTIPQGSYIGVSTNNQTKSFLGVRYAQTTEGINRFRPPVSVSSMNSTAIFNATSFGNICVQTPDSSITYTEPQSEDCLFLNIWAPVGASPTNQYPVMFWIHGGSFIHGTGNIYDGEHWVKTSIENNVPIVFVSINYRLGVFGFLADDLLKSENGLTNTNFGLLDQLEALKWVQSNIANFGGNPSQITISGESAGGISTLVLLASPLLSQVPVTSAIVQSGSSLKWLMQTSTVTALAAGSNLKTNFNCSTLECLRNITVDSLITYQAAKAPTAFTVTFDNYVITNNTYDVIDNNKFTMVNLLIGATRNEMGYFTCSSFPSNITAYQMQLAFSSYFGATKTVQFFPQLSNYYNISNYQDNLAYFNDVLTQAAVQCNARYLAASFSKKSSLNAYFYIYDHYFPFSTSCQKSMHAIEIPIQFPSIFKHMKGAEAYSLTASELELSRQVIVYWSNFVSSGNPNRNNSGTNLRTNQTTWNSYSTCSDNYLVIQSGSNYESSEILGKTCPFWNVYDEVPIIPCVTPASSNSTPIVVTSTVLPKNSTRVNGVGSLLSVWLALCFASLMILFQ